MEKCRTEKTELLLIAGDLFHRQPLFRELREVNALFSSLEDTFVVLCVGNHDYLKKDSYYRTFPWAENVSMIMSSSLDVVEIPKIHTAVYSFSYHQKEREDMPYLGKKAEGRQQVEILMVHGGDAKHVPVQKEELVSYGYDYVALGHIHKPQIVIPDKMAYSGALEPIDKNDTGVHGYISGEITDTGCRIEFVPFASREYVRMDVPVDGDMSSFELTQRVKEMIEKRGVSNIYRVTLKGFRNPDTVFRTDVLDTYGNVLEVFDETKPAYNFEKLREQNRDNILGSLIARLSKYDENSVEYRAMCEGVQALMETRRG